MGQTDLLIHEIHPTTKNWTTRVTITEDIPPLTCGTGMKLKRYILTDNEGNEIVATIFGSHITVLGPMVHLFNVYDITNAQNLTSFEEIVNNSYADLNSVDIMGVIISVDAPATVNTANGPKNIQRFTLIDTEKIPIQLTLWEEIAAIQGPILVEAAESLSIVVAKCLSIAKYKGVALSTKNSSSFAINPPIHAAIDLKSWIQSIGEAGFQKLLIDELDSSSNKIVVKENMTVCTLAELQTITKCDDHWVRGFLQILEENQKLYYLGGNKCSSKISTQQEGTQYTCNVCHREVVAILRLIVLLNVTDETATIKVIAMDRVAKKILQTIATDISRLRSLGQPYDLDTIRSDFTGKIFLVKLRRSFGTQNDGNRKLLLLSYIDDSFNAEDGHSSTQAVAIAGNNNYLMDTPDKGAVAGPSHSPLSPLKRQMSNITITSGSSARKRNS